MFLNGILLEKGSDPFMCETADVTYVFISSEQLKWRECKRRFCVYYKWWRNYEIKKTKLGILTVRSAAIILSAQINTHKYIHNVSCSV